MGVYLTSTVIEAYISGAWIDISDRVVTDLDAKMGMFDESYTNRLASPGSLSFSLNNKDGAYTPGPTFGKGTPIRVSVVYAGFEVTKFFGRIDSADIDDGTWGEERVHVRMLDWLDFATNQIIREQPVQTNKSIDAAATALIVDTPIPPNQVLLENGTFVFPSVFDAISKNTTIYRELNNLIMSEFGYGYMDRGGERLHIESSASRQNLGNVAQLPLEGDGSVLLKEDGDTLLLEDGTGGSLLEQTEDAVYVNTFTELRVVHGKHILNEVSFTVYPKKVDTSLKVLFTLAKPVFVPELSSVEITGYFSDPTGGARINGTSFTDPAATTDYMMNSLEDGTGTDLTANLTVTPVYSSEQVKYVLTNSGAAGYVTFLQQRGFGIYSYNPIEILAEDTVSQENYGVQNLSIRQPYQQGRDLADVEAVRILDIEKDPRNVAVKVSFVANTSDALMKSFMFVDISSLVKITNTKPAIDSYFFVQGMNWKIGLKGETTFSWAIKDVVTLTPIAVNFSGTFASRNAIVYEPLSKINSLQQMSLSAWVYLTSASSNFPIMTIRPTGIGWYWFVFSNAKMNFTQLFTPTDGVWNTTNDVFTAILNGWHHVAITYDNSNAANDPVMYVDGVSVPVTEAATPAGVADLPANGQLIFGNMKIVGDVLGYNFKGLMKDVRIYSRILSADEMLELASNENDYTTIPDSLLFQGFFVRNFRWNDYVGDPITPSMKVLDGVFETPGTVTYDTEVSNSEVEGADPELASY
jgi:hypothetical protein